VEERIHEDHEFTVPGPAISALVTILFTGPLQAQPPYSPAGKITNQHQSWQMLKIS
jgi:hypothetical protein